MIAKENLQNHGLVGNIYDNLVKPSRKWRALPILELYVIVSLPPLQPLQNDLTVGIAHTLRRTLSYFTQYIC